MGRMQQPTDAAVVAQVLAGDREAFGELVQRHSRQVFRVAFQAARSHPNRVLRKEAIFWLGQSKDPRALDFIVKFVEGNR